MKLHKIMTVLLPLVLTAAAYAGDAPPQGEWRCTAMTPRVLALTGNYRELELKLFRECLDRRLRMPKLNNKGWAQQLRFYLAGLEAANMYLPRAVGMLRDSPKIEIRSEKGDVSVIRTGYWLNPVGQAQFRNENGNERFSRNAEIAHYLFLTLDRPLADGEKISITMPAGEKIDFTYLESTPDPIFKINQVGYMPHAPKYAYLGGWLGLGGPLPLYKDFTGAKFELVDAAANRTVFTGTLKQRPNDPVTPKGTPFTGEEVLEMDFSTFRTPGRYYLTVKNLGRSYEFRIGDDTMAEAFYIHARGLYHLRCGIARGKPYTNWPMPACHRTCIRGNFPPEIGHYQPGKDDRPFGFRDGSGKRIKVRHFDLIAQNRPEKPEVLDAPGGWHDAADWDRRPQHLGIVGDLAALYLLKPKNFSDGQLDLPESGNGIPDILDEACWGIEHLRLKQQADGGVGTWIETTRHPTPRDGRSADDKLVYYLSCATRNSTLEYAAYASELALALRHAGAKKRAELYCDSARRAWAFASDPKNRVVHKYRYNNQTISYSENPGLDPGFVVKAGFNLFQLTGEDDYLRTAEHHCAKAGKNLYRMLMSCSPLFLMEIEVFPYRSAAISKLHGQCRRFLATQGRIMMRQQENNYPIRAPWYGVKEGWFHAMSWGNFHPLRRARVLIAAHALTGDTAFLDGACLANDFHNGANPFGTTMTSGLGKIYPVRFLDLNSYADGVSEFVPGITPYRNTFGIPRYAVKMGYGLYHRPHIGQKFPGLSLSLIPKAGLSESECAKAVGGIYPIWRRWCNVEGMTVAASEFTVWETVAPAAVVTGYLLNGASAPDGAWKNRIPADDFRKLPGYAPLP